MAERISLIWAAGSEPVHRASDPAQGGLGSRHLGGRQVGRPRQHKPQAETASLDPGVSAGGVWLWGGLLQAHQVLQVHEPAALTITPPLPSQVHTSGALNCSIISWYCRTVELRSNVL